MPLFPSVAAAVLLLTSLSAVSAAVPKALAAPSISAAGAQAESPVRDQTSQAVAGFSPLDPSPPTGLTADDIIKRFGAREAAFAAARQNYAFRQTVRVDTLSEDNGKVDGEYQQVTDIVVQQGWRSAKSTSSSRRKTPSSAS